MTLSPEELMQIGDREDVSDAISAYNEAIDNVYDSMSKRLTDEEVSWCEQRGDEYAELGGHDISYIANILSSAPSELAKTIFLNYCVNIDCICNFNFWNEGTRSDPRRIVIGDVGGGSNSHEIFCRTIYWNRVKMAALECAVADTLGILIPTLPALSVLDAAAIFLGVTSATIDYYRCINAPF